MHNILKEILTDEITLGEEQELWLCTNVAEQLLFTRDTTDAKAWDNRPKNASATLETDILLNMPLDRRFTEYYIKDFGPRRVRKQALETLLPYLGHMVHYVHALEKLSIYRGGHTRSDGMIHCRERLILAARKAVDGVLVKALDFGMWVKEAESKLLAEQLRDLVSVIHSADGLVREFIAKSNTAQDFDWCLVRICDCGELTLRHEVNKTCSICGVKPALLAEHVPCVLDIFPEWEGSITYNHDRDVENLFFVSEEDSKSEPKTKSHTEEVQDTVVDIGDAYSGEAADNSQLPTYYSSIDKIILSDSLYDLYPDMNVTQVQLDQCRKVLEYVECPPAKNRELEVELVGLLGEYANVLGTSRDLLFITKAQRDWCESYHDWARKAIDTRVTQLLSTDISE